MVGEWVERMGGGIFGAHKVKAEDDSVWLIKPIQHSFPNPTGSGKHWGMRGVLTEFIAGRLATRLGLNVPKHDKLYLYQETIDDYPELSDFTEGYVIAIAWQDGYDLGFLEKRPDLLDIVKAGLSDKSNSNTSFGIMIVDTLICNMDRYSRHLYKGMNSGHKGNILFVKSEGSRDIYNLTAIDFGLAFQGCEWGTTSTAAWAKEFLGMMKFFVRMGWLTGVSSKDLPKLEEWIDRISFLNLSDELDIILKEIPSEWHINTPAGLGVSSSDFNDLKLRLNNHQSILKPIVTSQYAPVYASVMI